MSAPELEPHCGSWVIVDRATGEARSEVFARKTADWFADKQGDRFEVLTAAQWLARVNKQVRYDEV